MPIGFDVLTLLVYRCKQGHSAGAAGRDDIERKGQDFVCLFVGGG